MSIISAIRHKLGLSVTPANNFTLTAEADNGTMKLARGNPGATTQDILTVDVAGKVALPQTPVLNTGPAFDTGFVSMSVPTGLVTPTKFALSGGFNVGGGIGANKFQPTVPGYYFIATSVSFAADGVPPNTSIVTASVLKNGVIVRNFSLANSGSFNVFISINGSLLIFLNGTTDFLEFGAMHNSVGTLTTVGGAADGFLVRGA